MKLKVQYTYTYSIFLDYDFRFYNSLYCFLVILHPSTCSCFSSHPFAAVFPFFFLSFTCFSTFVPHYTTISPLTDNPNAITYPNTITITYPNIITITYLKTLMITYPNTTIIFYPKIRETCTVVQKSQ